MNNMIMNKYYDGKRLIEDSKKPVEIIITDRKEGKIMTKRETIKNKLDALFNEHVDKCHQANRRCDLDSSNYELGYINAIREVMQIIWMEEVL